MIGGYGTEMLKDGERVCDICGEGIPKGQKYQKSTMPIEAAALLSAPDDPELIPTRTLNDDATVTMDICLTCTVSIGTLTPDGPSN